MSVRNKIANRYINKLANLPIKIQLSAPKTYSAYHLFVINFEDDNHVRDRTKIFNYMREAGVGVNVHYIPVHTHPYYKNLGFNWGDFPDSERYYQSALTLPIYPDLTLDNQDYVLNALQRALCI